MKKVVDKDCNKITFFAVDDRFGRKFSVPFTILIISIAGLTVTSDHYINNFIFSANFFLPIMLPFAHCFSI